MQDLFPFPPLESSVQRNSPMTFPNGRYFLIPQMQTCSRPVRLQSRFTVTPRSGWEVIADLVGGGASMLFEPTAAAVDTAQQVTRSEQEHITPISASFTYSSPPPLLPYSPPITPLFLCLLPYPVLAYPPPLAPAASPSRHAETFMPFRRRASPRY